MIDLEFGLFVTGKTEERSLDSLFRPLLETGLCTIKISWIPQVRPKKKKEIPAPRLPGQAIGRVNRLDEELAQKSRSWLCNSSDGWKPRPKRRLVLFDDLEGAGNEEAGKIFARYREAVDLLLTERIKSQAAVHFLANMLEAYFWAAPRGLEEQLGIEVSRVVLPPDPERIRHPKNLILEELKKLKAGRTYREIDDGTVLVRRLDLGEVLKDPQTCGYLRSAVGWMVASLERATIRPEVLSYFQLRSRFHLDDGIFAAVTRDQPVAESPRS